MENINLQNGTSVSKANGFKTSLDVNRLIKGIKLALEGRVKPSSNGKRGYVVSGDSGEYFIPETCDSCTCPWWQHHKEVCKHIVAVRVYRRLELKEVEIRAELSAQYKSRIRELEEKLRKLAEENLKLRTQQEAFDQLREGIKKLIRSL
jgi:uncharacterized Zn finger protein